jgi:hypothetical protein
MNQSLIKMFNLDPNIKQADYDLFVNAYFAEQNDNHDLEIARHDRALFRRGR